MEKDEVRVSLCGGDKCCPEVAIDAAKQEVFIGETGNLVKLDKRAWNNLVDKIKAGELSIL